MIGLDTDKPFHVVASSPEGGYNGEFVTGHATAEAASMDADRRNERAKSLKLVVVYHVRPKGSR